jgi:uncharacterized membrane protein YraQ (UPF0718 family)
VVDGFVFVAISGMVLFLILPGSVENGGWYTLAWMVAGALGPTLSERMFRGSEHRFHNVALVFGLVGIAFHGMLDGAALADGGRSTGAFLPLAVILHRFPVGLAIWWLVRPNFGLRAAAAVIALVIGSTIVGFSVGGIMLEHASLRAVAWFEAFVAGALIHVVVHRHRHEVTRGGRERRLEGVGALTGLALLVFLLLSESTAGSPPPPMGQAFLGLALESAPALVLAYSMAGFLSVLLPRSSVEWMRRGSAGMQALRGMTVGLPLPICSCGVVPLYRTLIRRGAPMTAAMAFLVATPELGLDAIFLSVPLLGGTMTVVRVLGAVIVALTVGWLVAKLSPGARTQSLPQLEADDGTAGAGVFGTVRSAMGIGFGEVVDHTAPWIILGLLIAAVAAPMVETGLLGQIPRGLDVVFFALVGLPIYVCAAAATPLVAVLLAGGVSPGAALAFLLTGPATNVTTFGVLAQLHGRRTAVTFSVTIIGLSLVLGWIVNLVIPQVSGLPVTEMTPEGASLLQKAALGILLLAVLASVVRRGARGFVGEIVFQAATPAPARSHSH